MSTQSRIKSPVAGPVFVLALARIRRLVVQIKAFDKYDLERECVCLCVREGVCVCAKERDRDREREDPDARVRVQELSVRTLLSQSKGVLGAQVQP